MEVSEVLVNSECVANILLFKHKQKTRIRDADSTVDITLAWSAMVCLNLPLLLLAWLLLAWLLLAWLGLGVCLGQFQITIYRMA